MVKIMNINEIVKKVRRELHEVPECSGHELKTKSIIRQFLEDHTDLLVEDYNGGIIALYDAGNATDTIAFRADFDAVSLPDGSAAHLCGHDGHTAALLGVALEIEKVKPNRNVLLIFQHAEETGEGAEAMVDALDQYSVSEIYGCHNLPGYQLGKVFTKYDTFACASCGMTFFIEGKAAHAAYPEDGKSPMYAVMELFSTIEKIRSSSEFSENSFATLIGSSIGQKAFGTSAEKAEVWITVRSDNETDFKRIKDALEYSVKKECDQYDLSYSIEIQDEFPATVNDSKCVDQIRKRCNGQLLDGPMRWSEDFGYFLQHKNNSCGAFFCIGAGECPNLHTVDYEYPDDLLEYQVEAFINLI